MSNGSSHPIRNCQSCGQSTLESVLFLGYVPPVNTMPEVGSIAVEEAAYPLEFVRCSNCGLSQIGLEVDPAVLFPYSYPYLSGTTRVLRTNFADLQAEASPYVGLSQGDLVIDVGSNDGSLLINFKEAGFRVLGIDPSRAAEVARQRGIETVSDYFGAAAAAKIRQSHGTARLVTAANVFAHIGNVHELVDGILTILSDDGVFVSESHYLLDLVETLQYDTIYHEHLRYYDLSSLKRLLEGHGLEIVRVKRIPTHGGSIRVYSARKGRLPVDASVLERLAHEKSYGLADGSALRSFRRRVIQSKLDLLGLLAGLKREGKRIHGVGAPSRASTLINYVGIDDGILDVVAETASSHKINKYLPGTRIPVVDEARLFQEQPDYALLLSWHIADELIANLRKKGFTGRFIVPLPIPHIVD